MKNDVFNVELNKIEDENIVTISYVVNDKSENIIIKKGSSLKSITEPQKEGYIFDRWKFSDGSLVTSDSIVNNDLEIIAI